MSTKSDPIDEYGNGFLGQAPRSQFTYVAIYRISDWVIVRSLRDASPDEIATTQMEVMRKYHRKPHAIRVVTTADSEQDVLEKLREPT